MEQLSLNSTYF